MKLDFLFQRLEEFKDSIAIIEDGKRYSYSDLIKKINEISNDAKIKDLIRPSDIVAIDGDFSFTSIALEFYLIKCQAILVPMANQLGSDKKNEFLETSEATYVIKVLKDFNFEITKTGKKVTHPMLKDLQEKKSPGLILFSSGTTGKSKGILHDLNQFMMKFEKRRNAKNMAGFLLFDHIGGVNTLFHTLSNGGTFTVLSKRDPHTVLRSISHDGIQVLPTSPSFLNLLLVSHAWEGLDLSSLELITYGTEPMSINTLERIGKVFPNVQLLQTYGTSETGILRSKSQSNGSLLVKIGGENYETRVVDNLLEIKSSSSMIGYLNAPSPFTEDGWFKTQDYVEVQGDYFLIKGRISEIINVGGEKVYPIEVENLISKLDFISDVLVYPEKNPLLGNVVCCKISTTTQMPLAEAKEKIFEHFKKLKVPRFQWPVKVEFTKEEDLYNIRMKKLRHQNK